MRAGAFDLKCTHTEQWTKPSTWLSTLGAVFWINPFGLDDRGGFSLVATPADWGWGPELGPPIPTAGPKQAADGQPNYRNSVDRSELVWSTSVGGLSAWRSWLGKDLAMVG
jgi:hypothetical protein